LGLPVLIGITLLLAGGSPAALAEDLEDDPVFKAMSDEMARNMDRLEMEDLERPYYLEYTVRDIEAANAAASFGGLTSSRRNRTRTLNTDLRVGSYSFDNTNFAAGGMAGLFRGAMGIGGRGRALPLDNDVLAIRHAIWLDTDRAYKSALENLAEKRALVKTQNIKDRPDDFSRADPNRHVGDRVTLSVDREKWEGILRRLSAIFRDYPSVQTSSVSWSAGVSNQYFINSEGSRHRWGGGLVTMTVSAAVQADDGMRLADSVSIREPIDRGLPGEEALAEKVRALADSLSARAAAPDPEDYSGPVLFAGDAAGEFFHQLLVRGVSNPRIPLFDRSGGFPGMEDLGQSLAQRVGSRILPKTFDVVDDPTLKEWEGRSLLGHYPVDDDGMAPQKVSLVEEGNLKTVFMSRIPTEEKSGSNGHGRGIGRVVGAPGNVIVKSKDARPEEELKKTLLDMCREEDLPYGIIVRKSISGGGRMGFPGGFRGGRRGRGGFGGRFGRGGSESRLVATRVYVEDGREEPTRGLSFQELSDATLRDIVAAGETRHVYHVAASGAPASVVAPSVLVEELDLREPPPQSAKKPYIDRP
jgi:predicted Zn-dependent protease